MMVEQLGDGEPELAVVGGIHGDEPCGVRAIERVLADPPSVTRPVKLIIANERALAQGVRYTETDLNRVFPGDPGSDAYETRLAHELLTEINDCTTLSMHSTQSYGRPFAIVDETGPNAREICPQLTVDALVEVGSIVGDALASFVDVIEVECGYQGSAEAVEYAHTLVMDFLRATGSVAGESCEPRETPMFELREPIPKRDGSDCSVLVENFERVGAGTAYAMIDGITQTAETPFYPVLMSANGYERQLGYAADKIGQIAPTPSLAQ
ncbi:M14 family metallopeptidase [Halocatena halophila]|uniref:succinylglutamate desuccinylase/aspartoacylase domain-containing protein n=1 Tax=Halocatena halophila TaxID=2814576 RepID=UPI002ED24159